MAIVNIGNYYAEWVPSGTPDKSGVGRIILRSATRMAELFWLNNLHAEDFRTCCTSCRRRSRSIGTRKPIGCAQLTRRATMPNRWANRKGLPEGGCSAGYASRGQPESGASSLVQAQAQPAG